MSVGLLTGEVFVARKRGNPGKPAGEGKLVRLDPSVVTMARMIAGARGIALTDYLSELLRPAVSRDYVKEMKRVQEEGGQN